MKTIFKNAKDTIWNWIACWVFIPLLALVCLPLIILEATVRWMIEKEAVKNNEPPMCWDCHAYPEFCGECHPSEEFLSKQRKERK